MKKNVDNSKTGVSLRDAALKVLRESALGPNVAYADPPKKLNPASVQGGEEDTQNTNNVAGKNIGALRAGAKEMTGRTGGGNDGPIDSAASMTGGPKRLNPEAFQGATQDLGAAPTDVKDEIPSSKASHGMSRTSHVPGGAYPAQEKYNPTDKKIFAEAAKEDDEDDDDHEDDDDDDREDDEGDEDKDMKNVKEGYGMKKESSHYGMKKESSHYGMKKESSHYGKKMKNEDSAADDEYYYEEEDEDKDMKNVKEGYGMKNVKEGYGMKMKNEDSAADDEYYEEKDEDDEDDKEDMKKEDYEPLLPEDIIEIGINSVNVNEHMAAILSNGGSNLSEEFKEKTSVVFEAALREMATTMYNALSESFAHALDEAATEYEDALTEHVDNYLGYVVEQWIAENEVAIESGLRSELTEEFITGLHKLFVESYIDVPDSKIDMIEALTAKVNSLEEKLNEEFENSVSLRNELLEAKRGEIFSIATKDLTDVQADKLWELSKKVVFEDVNDYAKKIETLKESYFSNSNNTSGNKFSSASALDSVDSAAAETVGKTENYLNEETANPRMARYVRTLSSQVSSPTFRDVVTSK
jgi:hypothetical protein